MGDDLVVQCPDAGDEEMVSRAVFLYSHVGGSGPRVTEAVDYRGTPRADMVVRKAGDMQPSDYKATSILGSSNGPTRDTCLASPER
ncbi:MAG: hypothetical protein V5A25_11970 [Halovenus sp.]